MPNQEENNPECRVAPEDGSGLIEIYKLIKRKKIMFFGIWGLWFIVSVGYVLNLVPFYEGNVLLQIGQVGQIGQIEDPTVLLERIKKKFGVSSTGNDFPAIVKIDILNSRSQDIITIIVRSLTQKSAKRFLHDIVNFIINEHQVIYGNLVSIQRERYETLKSHIEVLKAHLQELSKIIDLSRITDPTQASILTIEKGKILSEIPVLEERGTQILLNMSRPLSESTKIIGEPFVSDYPITSNLVWVLTLGIGFGLIFSIFCVFIIATIGKAKEDAPN